MKKTALLLLALPLAGCISPAERSAHLAMAKADCTNTSGDTLQCVNEYLGVHYGWREQALEAPDGSLCVVNCDEAVYRHHHYQTGGFDSTTFSNVFGGGFSR